VNTGDEPAADKHDQLSQIHYQEIIHDEEHRR
jgi:hypothetical protein